MAVCMIFESPGIAPEQYEQVRAEVSQGDRAPEGALYHVAGPTEQGWCVVEVWESRELLDRFFRERLGQALERAGISGQPRIFEVARIMHP